MTNENDELSLEEIKGFKFFNDVNFEDVLNRKCDSGITPMNLEIQRKNNLGIINDSNLDEKEEEEKERYTLFNFDSDEESNDDNE